MHTPFYHARPTLFLAQTPIVLGGILESLLPDDGRWDARPDPARFTLREVIAHLADWEAIWLERLTLTRYGAAPTIELQDPDILAAQHDYAHRDPAVSLLRFQERRAALTGFLESLSNEEWGKSASHREYGDMTIHDQAENVLGHDGYHLGQAAQMVEGPPA